MNIEQIAKTAHAVHRAYCLGMSIPTQPVWEEIAIDHKETIIDSVQKIINGEIVSKEHSHENFVALKEASGWSYGPEYSLENKTNPRLVPFDEMTQVQIVKADIFFECVKSFI